MPIVQNTPTRKDLQALAKMRLREAESLYKAKLYDGSVYLAGYAVELALKSRICKLLKIPTYPATGDIGRIFKTHDLEQLKVLAGLSNEIALTKNKDLFTNWSTAVEWDPEQRYQAPGKYSRQKAKEVIESIKSRPDGVFTWLTKRW